MHQGQILLITSDDDLMLSMARSLRGAGWDVVSSSTAQDGVAKATGRVPSLIVCDLELSDIEGTWVCAKLRGEPGKVSLVPILLLTDPFDLETALKGIRVGADSYLLKPVSELALVHYVQALVRMAKRYQDRKDSSAPPSSSATPTALRGDLEQMSLTTVLMLVEMERRSGVLSVSTDANGKQRAEFSLVEGTFERATVDGLQTDVKRALTVALKWAQGRFWFKPTSAAGTPNYSQSIGGLLLDAIREIDEAAAH